MTADEHEILSLTMRLLAQKTLLDWLVDMQRIRYGSLPSSEQPQTLLQYERRLSLLRQDCSTITMPGFHPVESDMRTALFQESFDELSKEMVSTIGKGLSGEELIRLSKLQK